MPPKYTNRCNKMAGYIQCMIYKHRRLQVTDKYYQFIPESVINVNSTTTMWGILVVTVQTVLANRHDIYVVLHDRKEKTSLLTNIVIPDDSNVNTKENEKLSKYKDLETEVSRM